MGDDSSLGEACRARGKHDVSAIRTCDSSSKGRQRGIERAKAVFKTFV